MYCWRCGTEVASRGEVRASSRLGLMIRYRNQDVDAYLCANTRGTVA